MPKYQKPPEYRPDKYNSIKQIVQQQAIFYFIFEMAAMLFPCNGILVVLHHKEKEKTSI